jgi:cell shape-determining protein MreC
MSDLINRLRYIGIPETIIGEVDDLQTENRSLKQKLDFILTELDEVGTPTEVIIQDLKRWKNST